MYFQTKWAKNISVENIYINIHILANIYFGDFFCVYIKKKKKILPYESEMTLLYLIIQT